MPLRGGDEQRYRKSLLMPSERQTDTSDRKTPTHLKVARERLLAMHARSHVGHIGGNLSSLDAMVVAFKNVLGKDDVFVLSKGHSAGALYTALWSIGRLSDEDLDTFHGNGTLLAGHPPAAGVPDIPFATGSLGHGFSLAAGTALGLRLRGKPGHVFCLTSDGEWQEGSTWEALIFSCHQRLSNLTVLIDLNGLQGFGTTEEVASMSDLVNRIRVHCDATTEIDGHDAAQIERALLARSNGLQIVAMHTVKGHGVGFMEGRMDSHYLPLDNERLADVVKQMSEQ